MLKFKLRRTLRGNIKAVSPVIATIIIVAVAITMSIAVAYWLLGLGGSFTRFEKIEYTYGYAEATGNPNEYVITLSVKNTGSAVATIDPTLILYNGRQLPTADAAAVDIAIVYDYVTADTANLVLDPGVSDTISLAYDPDGDPNTSKWQSGMTLEITLHTTGGKDYPKSIILP